MSAISSRPKLLMWPVLSAREKQELHVVQHRDVGQGRKYSMPQAQSELVFEQTNSTIADRRVVLIQLTLRDRKLYSGKIDGLFGPKTFDAVQRLQSQKGLAKTGKVDSATGETLGLPFWFVDAIRTLEPPFRDEDKFGPDTEFVFRSEAGTGYFFSAWPDDPYDSTNILTRRALRTNKPGALNISKWQKALPGYIGMTHPDNSPNRNKTTIYSSPEFGVAAWGVLLKVIYFKRKKDPVSVGSIIDKYRGSISREPYLAGYAKYSNGELVEDYMVDLYDPRKLAKLAIAAFSHEFGSWYPLTDEQLTAGFTEAERYIQDGGRGASIADLVSDEDEVEDLFAEGIDILGSLMSTAAPFTSRAERIGLEDASWPLNPANAPDTWQLPTPLHGDEFDLTAEVIDGLVSVGLYEPDVSTNGRLVIALRGCVLANGSASVEDAACIRVKPVRPDHENFRCLLGCLDVNSKLLSLYTAYTASTVPRRTGMLRFYNKMNFGTKGKNCNMLPTGCYEYCVGTHGGSAGAIEYVLRLGDGPTRDDAGQAVVLRTTNDLIYGTMDIWDNTRPADNIHPAFLDVSFSSLGCLTVRGKQTPNGSYKTGTGEWRKFRANVGFNGSYYGERFDCLLSTGYEAAAVASTLSDASDLAVLMCLRQGSRGPLVKQLQEQLGVYPADSQFGPQTCEELIARQRSKLGYATGTWSPAMAKLLELEFG